MKSFIKTGITLFLMVIAVFIALTFYHNVHAAEITPVSAIEYDKEGFTNCTDTFMSFIANKSYPEHMETDVRLLVEYISFGVIMCQMAFVPKDNYFDPRPFVFQFIAAQRNKEG